MLFIFCWIVKQLKIWLEIYESYIFIFAPFNLFLRVWAWIQRTYLKKNILNVNISDKLRNLWKNLIRVFFGNLWKFTFFPSLKYMCNGNNTVVILLSISFLSFIDLSFMDYSFGKFKLACVANLWKQIFKNQKSINK